MLHENWRNNLSLHITSSIQLKNLDDTVDNSACIGMDLWLKVIGCLLEMSYRWFQEAILCRWDESINLQHFKQSLSFNCSTNKPFLEKHFFIQKHLQRVTRYISHRTIQFLELEASNLFHNTFDEQLRCKDHKTRYDSFFVNHHLNTLCKMRLLLSLLI